jgi:outer membrane protein OmpA-like peptidoglycan-associated protein
MTVILALLIPTVGLCGAPEESASKKTVDKKTDQSAKAKPEVINKDLIVERLIKPDPSGTVGSIAFSSDAILFDYGSARLKKASHAQLTQIAKALNDPAVSVIPYFLVDGHTCSIGTNENNCRLSVNRAKSVVKFLVEEGGVSADKLKPRGFGESSPLVANDTEKNRNKNRRVVLKSGLLALKKDKEKQCSDKP